MSSSPLKFSQGLSDCLRTLGLVSLFSVKVESVLSELVGDFDPVGLKVFFTAIEKINSVFGFSLRSFRKACSLSMHSVVWICRISGFLLNFW